MNGAYIYVGNWTERYDTSGRAVLYVFYYNNVLGIWEKIQELPQEFSISKIVADKKNHLLFVCHEITHTSEKKAGGDIGCYRINEADGKLEYVESINTYGACPIDLSVSDDFGVVLNHGSNINRICHTCFNEKGEIKTEFSYDAANLVLFERKQDGSFGEPLDFFTFEGCGTVPFFQDTPSPHSLYKDKESNTYWIPERGTDRISIFSVENNKICKKQELVVGKEYGPRNVVMNKLGKSCFAITEIEARMLHFKSTESGYMLIEDVLTVPEDIIKNSAVEKASFEYPHPVDIQIHEVSETLYTLTRSCNVVAAYNLKSKEEAVRFYFLNGKNPRQMYINRDAMYIVWQDSGQITRFSIDKANGNLTDETEIISGIDRINTMEFVE